MAETLWDLSLQDALAQTASAAPTPGGGSIAAMSGAFGVGLVVMALEVTANNRPSEQLSTAIARGREWIEALQSAADRDVAVFRAYMQAVALPRATEAERAVRAQARQEAIAQAARAPLTAAESCVQALTWVAQSPSLVQKNVWSDVLAGADLVYGAFRAILRTLDINLTTLRDQEQRKALSDRAERLTRDAKSAYSRIEAAHAPTDQHTPT